MSVPIELLRCPATGQTLKAAPKNLLHSLQGAQRACTLRNRDGEIPEPFEDGLLTGDEEWFYPVRTGIPVLLAGEAIRVMDPKLAT